MKDGRRMEIMSAVIEVVQCSVNFDMTQPLHKKGAAGERVKELQFLNTTPNHLHFLYHFTEAYQRWAGEK